MTVLHLHPMVKVLCFYKAISRPSVYVQRYTDCIMIRVRRSEDIPSKFRSEMLKRIERNEFRAGPVPMQWHLLSYLPENGLAHFDTTRSDR